MGGNQALPILPKEQLYYVLVGQNVEFIPYTVPPGHPVLSLNLQKNLIKTLPPHLKELKSLILSENSLAEINEDIKTALLSYTSLKTLDLARNQLFEYTIEIPSLENLNLIQNRLTVMPNLTNQLNTISLDFNVIKTIDKSSTSLKQLTMSLNYIDSILDTIELPNLEILDFSMNRISQIPNFSKNFPIVKVVNLSYNRLTEVPPSLSQSLTELDLSGNAIEIIPEEIEKFELIESIDISFNKIKEIPKLPKSLKKITANDNVIQKVADSELPHLISAIFDNNAIEVLPRLTNHVSPTLFFSHNKISIVTLDMMIRPVEQLNLSDNSIEIIPPEIFSLPRLRILNLDSNKIESIPDEITNSHISSLLISQNPIKCLPILPKSLDSLYAAYCSISDVGNAFSENTILSKLCLSGNNIKDLPNIPSLQTLALSNCKLETFPQVSSKILSLDLSLNNIKEFPANFSAPYLTNLDVSHNQISKLPDISKYSRLVVLKVSANPIEGDLNLLKNQCLDTLDIYSTNIKQCQILPKMREVLTRSTNLQPPFRQIVCRKSDYASTIGIRKDNEDSLCVRDDLNFYLICDGHNGSVTSTKVANSLPLLYQQPHAFEGDFARSALIAIDETLREMKVRDGSTVVCAEIRHPEIITAHLGDARGIIVTDEGTVKTLTTDHRPTVRREFERIMHAGGRVAQKKTNGILTISRALGDYDVVGLSSEPEITHKFIDDNDKYLVIACDGLFDTLTNEETAKIASQCDSATEAAYKLRNIAFARGSKDNISVIVVPLKQ
ncbi:protein phosphatase 2C [Tritrichomonas foetus]|uniref:Protein phosphatase 2C n=1 Tax=Tritrichomonas foetus TaxID=1144522 RepID=A0A1J4JIK4_9EUKA|nr:protein phosphatase 2C [Tritrichomonas foetus]|eukprot:OHS98167.1 protein phosphatase 2C [Tritrichomonas foetus]